MRSPAAALALLAGACGTVVPAPEPPPMDPIATGCAAGDLVAQRCGAVSASSYLALAAHGATNEVVVVDASTGETCAVTSFAATTAIAGVTSLAVYDRSVVFCAAAANDAIGYLVSVSLDTGEVDSATTTCAAVTAFGGKVVVEFETGSGLQLIDSVGTWLSPDALVLPHWGTRLGFGDGKLYSTLPAPSTVFVYDPATKASSSFAMAPGGIAVAGLAVHGGALTLLDAATSSLISVDAATGAPVASVAVATPLRGLTNTCSGTGMLL